MMKNKSWKRWTTSPKKPIYLLFRLMIFSFLSSCSTTYANTAQQMNYEQWKNRQQQQDIRLKQQGTKTTQKRQYVQLTSQPTAEDKVTTKQHTTLGAQIQVNINTATAQELSAKLDSIGQKKSQAIVQYRQQHGAFKRIEELKLVKGIGDKLFEKNRNRIKLKD